MSPQFQNVQMPNISCRPRAFETRPLSWPLLTREFQHGDDTYAIRPIDTDDISKVCGLYNRHYPHLYRSSRHYLLERRFFEEEVAMASRWEDDAQAKDYYIGVIEKTESKDVIFAFGCYKEPHDAALQGLAIVLDPAYRGVRLTDHYIEYINALAAQTGADYIFGTAQVKDVIAQRIALRAGLKMGGIMPGAFRWSYDGETYYRDMLIYMYKFLNGAEAYSTSPQDWDLADKIATAHHKLYDIAEDDIDAP